MQNTRSIRGSAAVEPVEAGDLAELLEDLKQVERHLASAVLRAGRLAGSGISERVEGLPLDLLLGLAGRQTGADRAILISAGETLAHMPKSAALLADGLLSWGQVRAVTRAARRMSRAQRAWLDERIAATAELRDLSRSDPDELVWAVDAAADELRSAREAAAADDARERDCFFSVQSDFQGGARIYADLPDPRIAAPVIAALDAAGPPRKDGRISRRPDADAGADTDEGTAEGASAATDGAADGGSAEDADGATGVAADGHAAEEADKRGGTADSGDQADGEDGSWSKPSRSRQYAKALAEICAAWLGGGSGKPAKPLYVAGIDLSQVSVRADGTIMLAVRGDLPRISAAALERLANDADLRTVLFDGARPLAASKKVSMAAIPEAIRFAVAARDRGCRFPASPDPIAHTDIHHLHERSRGGDHHPDKLGDRQPRAVTLPRATHATGRCPSDPA